MLLSRSFKLSVLGLAMIAAGCDRQSADKAQPQASGEVAAKAGGEANPPGTIDRSRKGSALPDFTLRDADGKSVPLASLKGMPVLINLWATWCAPCIAELPQLDALAKRGKIQVVTVSQDMGDSKAIAAFLKEKGAPSLPAWLDGDGALGGIYEANTLPLSVFYDAQGREVWRFAGPRDWTGPETASLLAETS